MKIINSTRKTVVTETTETARGTFRKSLGLMFRRCVGESHGLLMEDVSSVWMLGMLTHIDIIFMTAGNVVIDIYENAPPLSLKPRTWRIYRPSRPVKWIIEVAPGRSRRSMTSVGDKLVFE